MSHLRALVAVAEIPPDDNFDGRRVYLVDGEIWEWEPIGCLVCAEAEAPSRSFKKRDDEDTVRCLVHGPLLQVPYVVRKEYTIRIGALERTDSDTVEDELLIPASMSPAEQQRTLERLMDAAEADAQSEEP